MITDELILKKAFTTTFPSDRPRDDCPSAEQIWDGARDELPPAQLRELVRHLAVCPLCTEAWLMAEEMEGPPMGKDLAPPTSATARAWTRGVALAATLVLAVAAGFFFRGADEPAPPATYRQAETPKIQLLSSTTLQRFEPALHWEGPPDARYYKLRVTSADDPLGEPLVVEPELKATQYRIAPELLERLPPGTRLQIHLEAVPPLDGLGATEIFYVKVQ